MKRAVVAVILGMALTTFPSDAAQNDRRERLEALIQARLESHQPVRLSAENITLTEDTLRLSGRVLIRFNDTSIRAEEAVFNQVTKRIDLIGNVRTFLGSAESWVVPPGRIEYR